MKMQVLYSVFQTMVVMQQQKLLLSLHHIYYYRLRAFTLITAMIQNQI